jgi:UDPglucose 6-dehydrogenase
MSDNLVLGIVGAGFVGSAVINAFDVNTVTQYIVDPVSSDTSMAELLMAGPDLIFVCVPTPSDASGAVDHRIVADVLRELHSANYTGVVVVKSTITPDCLQSMIADFALRIVYNPEFLTEANALNDFINPQMQILGGNWADCDVVERAYQNYSKVRQAPTFRTDVVSASLIKYTINSWLAIKVIFMNQIHQLHKQSGAASTWQQFTDMLRTDHRIGSSHMQVPGPDGKLGFGGHCFPKDTSAFLTYARQSGMPLDVLAAAVCTNKQIRKE